MPHGNQGYDTPKWRTFWMMIAFALLVGIGIATVLQPELEDEHGDDSSVETDRGGEPETDPPLQE